MKTTNDSPEESCSAHQPIGIKIFKWIFRTIFDLTLLGIGISGLAYFFSGSESHKELNTALIVINWPMLFVCHVLMRAKIEHSKELLAALYNWTIYKDSPHMLRIKDYLDN